MSTVSRAAAVVTTAVVMVLASTATAFADAPTTWTDGPDKSTLDILALLVGAPLGLGILISLFALVTARRNYVPPAPSTDVVPAGDHTPAAH